MQPCPCQPTCTTLPSSTRIGTVRWPPDNSRMRSRATGSASTSYSMNSTPLNSSHSRISSVCGQRAAPKSSSLAMGKHLQGFADHMVDGGLDFLNPRNVIAADDQRKIRECAPLNFASVAAEQRDGEHTAFPRFLEGGDDVARASAGGNTDDDIVRLGLG